MPKVEIKKIINRYARLLKSKNYNFSAIYLFGSRVNGKPHKHNDIDIAVVSNKLKRNYEKNRSLLYKMRLEVDDRLEPHGFTEDDFKDNSDPLAYEIRKTGIKVA